jgi:hypothetical protein
MRQVIKEKVKLFEWLNTLIEDYKYRILSIDLIFSANLGEMQSDLTR